MNPPSRSDEAYYELRAESTLKPMACRADLTFIGVRCSQNRDFAGELLGFNCGTRFARWMLVFVV